MIHNTNQLNEQQLNDLLQLAKQCKVHDGTTPNLYTHILTQHRAFPASLFYYDQDKLLGFLSAFFFYDDAVEISLLIHPKHRKQGIAKQLLQTILPLVQFHHYDKLIFSTPSGVNNKWLLAHDYTYLHSEYYMEREELTPILEHSRSALTFRRATIDDMNDLCILDELCFPKKHGDPQDRFEHLLDNREYELILAFAHDMLVGKAHIRWQEEGATLSDIAITPLQQGQGLGTSLIAHCINHALSEGKPLLNLDVETHNKRALNLYTRLGFAVHNACDYWSIKTATLEHLLSV